jgi:hypothetical protein
MLTQRNSRKQGDVGLGVAIGYFARQGFTVCLPLTDSQGFDLVFEDEAGVLRKVQVKTSRCRAKSGSWTVELRTKGGNRSGTGKTKLFDPSAVDFLFVVVESGDQYLIPAEKCPPRSITMGRKWDEYRV